jgi:hypothetical protein
MEMIDYEKLKIAHELAEYLSNKENFVSWSYDFFYCKKEGNKHQVRLLLGPHHEDFQGGYYYMNNLDELISNLREIIQSKPKYKVGQNVWLISYCGSGIVEWKIEDIDASSEEKYLFGDSWYKESELYPSKQSLIEAQIEYWQKLKIDEISSSKTCPKCGMQRVKDNACWSRECTFNEMTNEECQHESDGR